MDEAQSTLAGLDGEAGWAAGERRFKVFISYSRGDGADLAHRLVTVLEARGLAAKLDTRDLEFGERWQAQLKEFIRQADAVVYLISPRSVASTWCRWEVAEVAAQSKRLVPILHLDVPVQELPAELGEIHIFPMRDGTDFSTQEEFDALAERLAEGIQKDRGWLQEHTRLTEVAHEWMGAGRSSDRLLRGSALRAAERWVAARPHLAPLPSRQQLEFIAASQQNAKLRTRRWIAGLAAVAIFAVALAGLALLQWREATVQRGIADDRTREAVSNLNTALTNESRLMARLSAGELARGDAATAMALAIEALPGSDAPTGRPLVAEAATALAEAKDQLRELAVMLLDGVFYSPSLSAGGDLVATGSDMQDKTDKLARIYSASDGRLLKTLDGFADPVHFVAFNGGAYSGDSTLLVTIDEHSVRVWQVDGWNKIAETTWEGGVYVAAFSDDFDRIWIGAMDGTVAVWRWSGSQPPQVVGKHDATIDKIVVSSFSYYVAASSEDGALSFWKGRTLEPMSSEKLRFVDANEPGLMEMAELIFSPNGDRLISVPAFSMQNRNARIWDVDNGKLDGEVALRKAEPGTWQQDVALSSGGFVDGRPVVAVARANGEVRLDGAFDEPVLKVAAGDTLLSSVFMHEGEAFAGTGEAALYLWFRDDGLVHEWNPAPLVLRGLKGSARYPAVRDYLYRPRNALPEGQGGLMEYDRQDILKLLLADEGTVRVLSTRPPPPVPEDPPPPRAEWTSQSAAELIRNALVVVPRCLTQEQRAAFFLSETPPRWCITGAGRERETDPARWSGKWPYHTADWREWLAARDRGEAQAIPQDKADPVQ